eukprot:TRINITY_DN7475_c1_g1_i2.p3 TRINITY_DN7475_c1_g1~~TRINITY_DN7475_c1_g1_i2.p3  ORF type:complete len:104 (-),score=9.25 TRINITY_DN7475_c1_g1_i2:74-385(-)
MQSTVQTRVRFSADALVFGGELAQMVERSLSMREVEGSIPSFSNEVVPPQLSLLEHGCYGWQAEENREVGGSNPPGGALTERGRISSVGQSARLLRMAGRRKP